MEINLRNISLRPFKTTDVDDFIIWAGDEEVTKQLVTWKTITCKEEALTFIKDVCIPHPWRRSICMEDDRSIGMVSIYPGLGDDRCRAHIGYAVSKVYWNKGIASRALKMAMLQVVKDYPDLVRLQTLVSVENKASQRVLDKCGFVKEGLLRKYSYLKGEIKDVFIYGILSTELPSVDQ
ncbi:hypothetical protein SOVF_104280 [Spinacia oleracea]|uniref:N-acetyltransferase domain-containing protein n=1 Tax=Spinacia oleracea TaxID=3562 RepID=A0A9R0J6F6_SPIOL|nr:uncharacterized protein LOC110801093 [Spinacia oleracea]KNA14795.1 hypothetical protein SOVF_104280 [Spinacia oleracea]